MDSMPTIDLGRPRSVADILGSALDLYQGFPWLFLILALGVVLPYDLIRLAVTGHGWLASGHEGVGASVAFGVLDFALVGPLISALHIHAVVEIGDGQRPRLAAVALRGLRVLPVVAAAEIIATLGIAAGLIALIIPGILLLLRWAVVAQAAAIEPDGWLPALRRSRELTRGHYWHILALIAIVAVLNAGIVFAARAIPAAGSAGAGTVMLGVAVNTITASFSALTLAILYFDLLARVRAGTNGP
jgi:hypothetical protein